MPGTTIITGAASGIGAALALRCALPGVGLVLHTGSRSSQLDHVADACRAKGATVHCVCGELAMTATVDALLGAVQVQGASLAAVVANAGFAINQPLAELDICELNRSLQVMVGGLARLMQVTLPPAWKTAAQLTPMGRVALPDEIAGVVAFLLGQDGGFITGQTIHVDGGLTL